MTHINSNSSSLIFVEVVWLLDCFCFIDSRLEKKLFGKQCDVSEFAAWISCVVDEQIFCSVSVSHHRTLRFSGTSLERISKRPEPKQCRARSRGIFSRYFFLSDRSIARFSRYHRLSKNRVSTVISRACVRIVSVSRCSTFVSLQNGALNVSWFVYSLNDVLFNDFLHSITRKTQGFRFWLQSLRNVYDSVKNTIYRVWIRRTLG